jgi:hypothetical protein
MNEKKNTRRCERNSEHSVNGFAVPSSCVAHGRSRLASSRRLEVTELVRRGEESWEWTADMLKTSTPTHTRLLVLARRYTLRSRALCGTKKGLRAAVFSPKSPCSSLFSLLCHDFRPLPSPSLYVHFSHTSFNLS